MRNATVKAQDIRQASDSCHLLLNRGAGHVAPLIVLVLCVFIATAAAPAEDLALVTGVEAQPLKAQVKRIAEALEYLGEPLRAEDQAAL